MIFEIRGGAKLFLTAVVFMRVCFFVSAAVTDKPGETLDSIRKNRYLTESLNLQKLAKQSFAGGDYDKAERFAEEALKTAIMSDVYVGQQIKIYTVNVKMSNALERLALADSAELRHHFPSEFYAAKTYYNLGLIAKDAGNWNDAINNADKVIKTLATVKMQPVTAPAEMATAETTSAVVTETPAAAPAEKTGETPLPSQYIVRSWDVYGDCFWNIAGRPWVYGDSRRWPLLYRANRNKLPEPDNPNLIEAGMVIDIPSLNGEERTGVWDPGKAYSPLKK
jgi:tetratricopeptide (TPR) repeat protein